MNITLPENYSKKNRTKYEITYQNNEDFLDITAVLFYTVHMKYLKIFAATAFATFLVLVLLSKIVGEKKAEVPTITENTVKSHQEVQIPATELVKGQTYQIKWPKGEGSTQIFLVDKSLEEKGVSVSITDRIYGVSNSGTYEYTVPQNITDGEYRLEVGTHKSKYFQITSN